MQPSNPFVALILTLSSKKTFNLERNLTTGCERVKIVYPSNVYQIREIVFDKLESFAIKYKSEEKLVKSYDFESICVQTSETPIQQPG